MGEVYKARDARLNRDVAIKILPPSFSADPERLQRFAQESRAAAALNHPNILSIYDIGEDRGAPYVVSELLEGETLRDRVRNGPLAARKAIDYAQQIARGLAAAHERGIVHRDLKPENIFVTNDGRAKILDFGLAKFTQPEAHDSDDAPTVQLATEAGTVLGTAGYMAPEQVRGKPADSRSDIFAFGAILYEMLSGKRAFHADTAADTMSAILKEDPPDLAETNRNISPALERIVNHCLEKNPAERFQSARDVAFNLEALTDVSAASRSGVRALPEEKRVARWLVPALALLLISVSWAAVLLCSSRDSRRQSHIPRDNFPQRQHRRSALCPRRADNYLRRCLGRTPAGTFRHTLRQHRLAIHRPPARSDSFGLLKRRNGDRIAPRRLRAHAGWNAGSRCACGRRPSRNFRQCLRCRLGPRRPIDGR